MSFRGEFLGTGIGSLPMSDPGKAMSAVLANLQEIPFWPQLPQRGFREQMVPQYIQAFPGIVEDAVRERVYVETARSMDEMENFYEKEMAGDLDYFAITSEYAAGLDAMINELRRHRPDNLCFTKGHVTGPVTFGFTVKDEKGAAIFYDPNLADVVSRLIAMKALYQIRLFQEFKVPTIIFMDEPYMAAFGTTGMNITREEGAGAINVVVDKIHEAGGIAGVHCCGNTDWSLLFETRVAILNFDAFHFMERMALYPEQVQSFLERGGVLAWGIVPTSVSVRKENAESLADRILQGVEMLVRLGVDKERLLAQALITPACGMGSLPEEDALRALSLVRELSLLFRQRYPAS